MLIGDIAVMISPPYSYDASMTKIINTYQNLAAAQEAVAQLSVSGFDPSRLSVIGHGDKRPQSAPRLKRSLLWGGALGAAMTFVLPGGGHLLLAGHLARTVDRTPGERWRS